MGIIIDLGSWNVSLYEKPPSYFLGGNPKHDRIGFRYWRAPDGPMGKYLLAQVKNESLSIFLGFWATLTNALFAYMGTELIGVRAQDVDLFVFLTYCRHPGYCRRG